MPSALERKLSHLLQKLEHLESYQRLVPVDKFCKDKGYTRRQIDHLRTQYPQIWKGIGGDKTDKQGRTVWREIVIDVVEFNALFSSPNKQRA